MSDETPSPNSLEKTTENKPQEASNPPPQDGGSVLEPEVLNKLPPEVRKAVEFTLASFSTPVFHPITKKITEGHIDKVLDSSEKDSDRHFKDRTSQRRYGFAAFIVLIVLFVFLTWYLTGVDQDLYRDIIKVLLGVLGGFGGGFAFKSYLDRDD